MTVGKFIQIGAGAGNRDARANNYDWFTKYVKSRENKDDQILLVEANPVNIPELKKTWSEYRNSLIFNHGIQTIGSEQSNNEMIFYFAPEDGPHFQVTSARKEHVIKHYPNSNVQEFCVPSININRFLDLNAAGICIDLIAIDIEGLDYEVLMDLDIRRHSINCISYENIHGNNAEEVSSKLISGGYELIQNPWDILGYDVLYRKL